MEVRGEMPAACLIPFSLEFPLDSFIGFGSALGLLVTDSVAPLLLSLLLVASLQVFMLGCGPVAHGLPDKNPTTESRWLVDLLLGNRLPFFIPLVGVVWFVAIGVIAALAAVVQLLVVIITFTWQLLLRWAPRSIQRALRCGILILPTLSNGFADK